MGVSIKFPLFLLVYSSMLLSCGDQVPNNETEKSAYNIPFKLKEFTLEDHKKQFKINHYTLDDQNLRVQDFASEVTSQGQFLSLTSLGVLLFDGQQVTMIPPLTQLPNEGLRFFSHPGQDSFFLKPKYFRENNICRELLIGTVRNADLKVMGPINRTTTYDSICFNNILRYNSNNFIFYSQDEGSFLSDRKNWKPILPPEYIPVTVEDGGIIYKLNKDDLFTLVKKDTTGKTLWEVQSSIPCNDKYLRYYGNSGLVNDESIYLFSTFGKKNNLVLRPNQTNRRPPALFELYPDYGFVFQTPEGLVFRHREDKTLHVERNQTLEFSPLLNRIEDLIAPDQLGVPKRILKWPHDDWYPTEKGYVHLRQTQSNTTHPGIVAQKGGFSTRGIFFGDNQKLYLGAQDTLFQILSLDTNSIPGKLQPVQHSFFSDVGKVHYFLDGTRTSMSLITGHGFYHYELSTDSIYRTKRPNPNRSKLYGYLRLPSGKRIIGSTFQLYFWSPKNPNRKLIPIKIDGCGGISNVNVNRLKYDQSRESLLVCSNNGLLLGTLDTMTKQFHCEQDFELGPVHDAYIRDTNQLFVATQNNGILLYDLNTGEKIYSFNKQNHLSHNYCHNILEDQSGRIWASSNNGLYCIDLDQGWVQELNSNDGLVNDEFNRLASAKGPSGLLAFGGINGVSVLDPSRFNFTRNFKAVKVTGIQTQSYGEEVTHIYEPQAVSDRIAAFKIPNHIRSIRPLFPFTVLGSDLKLYYRVRGKDAFWIRAKHSHIPTSSIHENQIIELLWTSPGEWYHSEIQLNVYSNTPLYTQVYAFLLFAVVVIFFIIRLKKSNEDRDLPQEDGSQTSPPSNDTQIEAQEATSSPLQAYLSTLTKMEELQLNYDPSYESQFMKDLNDLINQHLSSSQLSVSFMAKQFNLSTRQFHRNVIEHTDGLTPGKYISWVRLIKSKEIILDDLDIRISEVSEKVGYSTASYLTAKFKEFYGVTPKEFVSKIKSLRKQS